MEMIKHKNHVTFTVRCTMKSRWVPQFLGLLMKMEYLGKIGSSKNLTFFADGDGGFRPYFSWHDDLQFCEPQRIDNEGNCFFDAG